jgi:hypothetical protein
MDWIHLAWKRVSGSDELGNPTLGCVKFGKFLVDKQSVTTQEGLDFMVLID